MKVELERDTLSGRRMVHLTASDSAGKSETLRQWIKMLRLAEKWLSEKEKVDAK